MLAGALGTLTGTGSSPPCLVSAVISVMPSFGEASAEGKSDIGSFLDYSIKVDKKLIGKHVIAPIPIWLAYSYEENLEKIKKL